MAKIRFSKTIRIADKIIARNKPVFIIAELGVNHNGDLALAKEMIDAAAQAGADAVKLQNYHTENVLTDLGQTYSYEQHCKIIEEPTFAMLKRLELPDAAYAEIFAYARSRGIIPFATVVDKQGMDNLAKAGADLFKIASATISNRPLLQALGALKKPLILSTGMTTKEELLQTVKTLKDAGLYDCIFLHCVSLYPTPNSQANLSRMSALAKLTHALAGYSDHTLGIDACLAATAMGACVLEKHFTLDKSLPGPDHAFSADPGELKRLVNRVREVEELLGSGHIDPGEDESESRKRFCLSVTARRDMEAGSIICTESLCLKRPGTGLPSSDMDKLIGKKLKLAVKKDQQISWSMLDE